MENRFCSQSHHSTKMNDERRGAVSISLAERLTRASEKATSEQFASTCFIFRVPDRLILQLSPGNDMAYIPEVVSIGPYHLGDECLRGMDYHKCRALNSILHRTHKPLKYFLDPMYELVKKTRVCYQGLLVDLTEIEFAEMLLLDGCFMLEIIRGHNIGFDELGYSSNDPVFTRKGYNNMASSIAKDMIKLENQIPFSVLEKLLDLQKAADTKTCGEVAQLASVMFIKWLTGEKLESTQLCALDGQKGKFIHCLNVFQFSLLLGIGHNHGTPLEDILEASMTSRNNYFEDQQSEFFHSATDLVEYGVMFKRPKRERRPFWDIRFKKNGHLEIPRIYINNRFKVTFQNLIMFEQLCRKQNYLRPLITEYVTFMDKLINSATDVGHLHHAGIIVHQLRSDADVANLFNELGKVAFLDPRFTSHYSSLYQTLNAHCNRWNQWKSELRRTYFGNPWAVSSVFAAIVLLLLAFSQTIYTIYPYYWPKSH